MVYLSITSRKEVKTIHFRNLVIAFAINVLRSERKYIKFSVFHNSLSSGIKWAFRISRVVSLSKYRDGGTLLRDSFVELDKKVIFAISLTSALYSAKEYPSSSYLFQAFLSFIMRSKGKI